MRFTQAYAGGPVCSPARAALMAGKTPARMDTTDWFGARRAGKMLPAEYTPQLPLEEVTLAEALRAWAGGGQADLSAIGSLTWFKRAQGSCETVAHPPAHPPALNQAPPPDFAGLPFCPHLPPGAVLPSHPNPGRPHPARPPPCARLTLRSPFRSPPRHGFPRLPAPAPPGSGPAGKNG